MRSARFRFSKTGTRLLGCAVAPFMAQLPIDRFLPALGVPFLFALAAWMMRAVTLSGAAAGAVTAFLIYYGLGFGGFLVLFAVFVVAVATTSLGYERKLRLGIAQSRHGRRGSQVLANLAVAAACATVFGVFGRTEFALAAVAALAEAAADTAASECGQAWSSQAYLITTFRQVQPGTDGGVSLVGTLAGLVAAIATFAVALGTKILPPDAAHVVIVSAMAGLFADSILGASLQRRGWLNNDAVNILGTAVAAAVALLMAVAVAAPSCCAHSH